MQTEADPRIGVRGLMEEVRVWKEKNRNMENAMIKDRETRSVQEDHVKKLE